MKLVSIRVITDDIQRLVSFYQHVTGVEANWATPDFAEIVLFRDPDGNLINLFTPAARTQQVRHRNITSRRGVVRTSAGRHP
ncbi:VOC family protein [Nocardia sp. NPDC056541]|uniref:VOC family protein n=1 Tax=Nocardia sp. NPDC056541 TaxID=3345860 RepID=UPI00366E9245